MKKTQAILTVALMAVLVTACGKPPTPLEQLLSDLEDRVEARDAEGVTELLAPEFSGEGGLRRAAVPAELKRYFFAYESLDVTLSGVEADDPPRKVTLRVDLEGRPKEVFGLDNLVPAASAHRFVLELAGDGGPLRIKAANWERIDRLPE